MRCGLGELPVPDLFGAGALRFPLPLAVGIDEGVGQDPEQPRLEVSAFLELVERRVGPREGLLHQVFGVSSVVRHPHRGRVQLVQVREHITLETGASLLKGLRDRTWLLRYRRGHLDVDLQRFHDSPSATWPDPGVPTPVRSGYRGHWA